MAAKYDSSFTEGGLAGICQGLWIQERKGHR